MSKDGIMSKKIIIVFIICLIFLIGCSNNTSTKKDSQATVQEVKQQKKELSVKDYIDAFKLAGLPVDNIIVFNTEKDPNNLLGRPNQYIAKASWADTRIEQPIKNIEALKEILSPEEYEKELKKATEDPLGGTIEIFNNTADLENRKKYIEVLSKGAPIFNQYIYVHNKTLIRLEHDLTPKQASDYEKVLKSLK